MNTDYTDRSDLPRINADERGLETDERVKGGDDANVNMGQTHAKLGYLGMNREGGRGGVGRRRLPELPKSGKCQN